MVDASGAYRALVQYRVTNAKEQFLELELPAGARLWTAQVAGEPVKPAETAPPRRQASSAFRSSRRPRAKATIVVELKYGGQLPAIRRLRPGQFSADPRDEHQRRAEPGAAAPARLAAVVRLSAARCGWSWTRRSCRGLSIVSQRADSGGHAGPGQRQRLHQGPGRGEPQAVAACCSKTTADPGCNNLQHSLATLDLSPQRGPAEPGRAAGPGQLAQQQRGDETDNRWRLN